MTAFRITLAALWVAITAYTAVVIANHGIFFLPVYIADIARMGWAGQFDVDFGIMLILAALWVAWRHGFSGKGILFSVLTMNLGAFFITAYLFIVSGKSADMKAVLVGDRS